MASRRSLWPAADQGIRKACGPTAHMNTADYVPSVTTLVSSIVRNLNMKLPTPRSAADFKVLSSANCVGMLRNGVQIFHSTSVLLGFSFVDSTWIFSDSRNETEFNLFLDNALQLDLSVGVAAFFDWRYFEQGRYWMAMTNGRAGILCKRPKSVRNTLITTANQKTVVPMVFVDYRIR